LKTFLSKPDTQNWTLPVNKFYLI